MPAPVRPRIDTAVLANVNDTNSSVTLAAANSVRTALWVYNDSTAILYIKCGSSASSTSYSVQVAAGGFWEMPSSNVIYTGIVTGIWASDASGAARVTEF